MFIQRDLSAYVVYGEESVVTALERITANQSHVVFVLAEHGQLIGVLTDGDFRRWISANPTAGLDVRASAIANRTYRSAAEGTAPVAIERLFAAGIDHIPLVDAQGHLRGIAINRHDQVRVGDHLVGPNSPTVVISEIGINHQGSVDFAKQLVDLSKQAGADVVKFQLRDMDALYRQGSGSSAGEDLGPQYVLDLLAKYNLGPEDLFEVFDHCRNVGIEVMCTAWDRPSVDKLAQYGVGAFKVASADMTNHDLLTHMSSYGTPLVVSTGMSTEAEIIETVDLLRSGGSSYALLHCQSTYPAPFKDINLRYLQRLKEIGLCPVGYSGHERGSHIAVAAVAMGAKIVEKHFTTDRSLEGNDHKVSLLPEEFAEMVQRIREVEEALGTNAPRSVSTGEMMNRINLAKSLVAARPIEVGEVIQADAVDIKSPGRGLQPNSLGALVGRTSRRRLEAGDFFYATDLSDEVAQGRDYAFRRPWGLPVRYHDYAELMADSNPDFLEFHFSYKDLDLDLNDVFGNLTSPLPMGFACHSPDLFAGDFLLNLASDDDAHWRRSIRELQRVVDTTRAMRKFFADSQEPVVIASLGGFTTNAHLRTDELAPLYARVAEGLKQIDDTGVRLCAQTLPPFPWYMGGQLYCNLFVDPRDTAEFAQTYQRRLVFDVSHSKLSANFLGMGFDEATALLAPHTEHLHLVDATGVDGEGVQVGEGEIDWPLLAVQLDELAPNAGFIPEIWQGHVNNGEGFWTALERLEAWL